MSGPADVEEVRAQVEELRAQLRDLEDRQATAEAERRAPRAGRTKGRHEGEVSVTTESWTKSRDADNRREWEKAVERSLARRKRRWAARARRWTVVLAVWLMFTGVGATVWGKGSPFAAPDCGRSADNTAVVAAESVGVRTAKLNGRLLHRLAGKPPSAEEMRTAADRAGRTAVVFLAALRSSARGQRDPAVVSSYNAAYQARNAASCAPPCPDPGSLPGTRSVAATGGEAVARAAAAAAGFRDLAMPVEVARLETGGTFKATAANPASSARGMWQIMLTAHQDDPDIRNWADPYASARMAFRISRGGTDWSPWTTAGQARANLAGKGARPVVAGQPAADCASSPSTVTYQTGAGVPWGGYANGRIPLSALVHPRSAPAAWLRPDAAAALDRLSAAYAARFGHPLGVTDSYRDLPGQVSVARRKPGLAAKPGTSNHGWALALDLVVGGYGSTDYLWLRANAPAFGWDNPQWARGAGPKDEPWHWEYQPLGATT